MARSGPVPVQYMWGPKGGVMTELEDITECTGGGVMADSTDTTAYGHEVKNEGPTGTKTVDPITIKGFYDPVAGTAFTLIGRPQTDPNDTIFVLQVLYDTGTSRTYEVWVKKNDPVKSLDDQTRFEATLIQGSAVLAEDFVP